MEACKFFSSGGSTWGKSWRSEERGKIGRKAVSIDKEFCRAELKQKLSFYQLSSLCAKTTSRCLYLPERNQWNMRCTMHNPSTWSSQGGQKPGRHRLNTPAIGKNGEASINIKDGAFPEYQLSYISGCCSSNDWLCKKTQAQLQVSIIQR